MTYFKFCGLAAIVLAAAPISAAAAHEGANHALETARIDEMRETAVVFLSTLDDAQRATATAALEDSAARTGWSNLPVSMAPRPGLAITGMTAPQRRAFHAMMAAALSSQGYLKTTTIIWHEDVLHDLTAQRIAAMPDDDPRKAFGQSFIENYDSEKFHVVVFGDPNGEDWAWTVTGHHYAVNFTVAGGKIGFTPLFLGANPQIVPEGRYAGWRILQHEADRAFALTGSLQGAQLQAAVIADAVDDAVFAGHGQRERMETVRGVKASDLTPVQLHLLRGLIDEYLDDASDEAADRQRTAIEADGLESLHFSWWGPTGDPSARYMYRVHGPSILIDYVRESSPDGGFNHVHSVVRDPSNDYGSEWLNRHYEEAHRE